jgi:hypothetical protein
MAVARSPFMVFEDFLSPKMCESIVDELGFYSPDTDPSGAPIKMYRFNQKAEDLIFERFQQIIPQIMDHYETKYRGTEQVIFEYFAEGTVSEPLCENSNYIKKKWVRTKDRDITAVLFLSDYNDDPPFDSDYEVYGGKLEFPQHQFGFNPQRGTLVVYPSGPHFINASAAIVSGDLHQARIHLAAAEPFLYNPQKFPGDYRSWFKNYL